MVRDLASRLRAVEDELAIRALGARFADCVNERDYCGFADLWSAHAVWEIGPPVPARATGVDAIVGMLRRFLEPQIMFILLTHPGVTHITADLAAARFTEHERGRAGMSLYENLAVHEDVLAREADGVWRFVRRSYRYRYLDSTAVPGRVFPLTAGPSGASV